MSDGHDMLVVQGLWKELGLAKLQLGDGPVGNGKWVAVIVEIVRGPQTIGCTMQCGRAYEVTKVHPAPMGGGERTRRSRGALGSCGVTLMAPGVGDELACIKLGDIRLRLHPSELTATFGTNLDCATKATLL